MSRGVWSLNMPRPILQSRHSTPRHSPVSWQWSNCGLCVTSSKQIMQSLPNFLSNASLSRPESLVKSPSPFGYLRTLVSWWPITHVPPWLILTIRTGPQIAHVPVLLSRFLSSSLCIPHGSTKKPEHKGSGFSELMLTQR